ncbi:MAG: phosphohydrolase, partial [Clostridiales bacterium]|nr:phosphohydrolase [Clostridiales bacterium]
MKKGFYIITYKHHHVDPLNPKPEDVDIRDIAHALSMLCRANGHFRQFYSVGQHSLNCAGEAQARGYSFRIQLACLMHDASEAYLADITTPVKDRLPEYRCSEDVWMRLIYDAIGLGELREEEMNQVHQIDKDILYHEFITLMGIPINKDKPPVLESR